MRISSARRLFWLRASAASSLLTVSAFVALLTGLLIATTAPSPGGSAPGGSSERAGTKSSEPMISDSSGDADLELTVVDVGKRGEGIVYRLGGREADNVADLRQLLGPLAKVSGSISVRIGHDMPFGPSAEAIAACRDAGFATVHLLPRAATR